MERNWGNLNIIYHQSQRKPTFFQHFGFTYEAKFTVAISSPAETVALSTRSTTFFSHPIFFAFLFISRKNYAFKMNAKENKRKKITYENGLGYWHICAVFLLLQSAPWISSKNIGFLYCLNLKHLLRIIALDIKNKILKFIVSIRIQFNLNVNKCKWSESYFHDRC